MSTISLGRDAQLAPTESPLYLPRVVRRAAARQPDFLGLALNDRHEGAALFGASGLPERL